MQSHKGSDFWVWVVFFFFFNGEIYSKRKILILVIKNHSSLIKLNNENQLIPFTS